MKLGRYNRTFTTRNSGLKLGSGTRVEIKSVELRELERNTRFPQSQPVEVVATIQLTAEGVLEPRSCSTCKATSPGPNTDGLWYILENHDGNRLLFAEPEEEAYSNEERDQYPIPGWRRVNGELNCVDCAKELEEAIAQTKAARKRKKESQL